MITLFIIVGIYTIECFGSSCYAMDRFSLESLIGLGLVECVFEIPNIIRIFRAREGSTDKIKAVKRQKKVE